MTPSSPGVSERMARVRRRDTAPELETEAPKGMVKVYPRKIDLENTERLKSFDATVVAETLIELQAALARRRQELAQELAQETRP